MLKEIEPTLELISRDVPSVEAHHCSVRPDAGRNSGGRRIIKKLKIKRMTNKLFSTKEICHFFDSVISVSKSDQFLISLYKRNQKMKSHSSLKRISKTYS